MYSPYRGLRGLGDGEVNPDGSATYDGAPYDPNDTNNPYNVALAATLQAIAVSSTPIGSGPGAPAPLITYVQPSPPVTGYTPVATTTGGPASTVKAAVAGAPSLTPLLLVGAGVVALALFAGKKRRIA